MFYPIGFGGQHWFLYLIVPAILGIWAQIRVSSAFSKWGKVRASSNITGAECAREIFSATNAHRAAGRRSCRREQRAQRRRADLRCRFHCRAREPALADVDARPSQLIGSRLNKMNPAIAIQPARRLTDLLSSGPD